jgi:hypothetical protein
MGRLCQVIVATLHELLAANIRVMSAAALASLFLEMNFIEGIIPSSFKTTMFDESIEQSYELMLKRLLELVKRKPPSPSSHLAQVSCFAHWRSPASAVLFDNVPCVFRDHLSSLAFLSPMCGTRIGLWNSVTLPVDVQHRIILCITHI